MLEVHGAVAMLSDFAKVCDGMSQAIKWSTTERIGTKMAQEPGISSDGQEWANLHRSVNTFFANRPGFLAYKSRWDNIVNQVSMTGSVTNSTVERMRKLFDDMKQSLLDTEDKRKETMSQQRAVKFFISHKSTDKDYCQSLVNFLMLLGFKQEEIVCTSIPNCGPSVGTRIFEWLRSQFDGDLHVIYMLSDDYFESVSSICEMGAAWVTQKSYTAFILPGFSMKKVEGPIDPNKMGVDLNSDDSLLRAQLKQFAKNFTAEVRETQIEYAADQFIQSIKSNERLSSRTGELQVNQLIP